MLLCPCCNLLLSSCWQISHGRCSAKYFPLEVRLVSVSIRVPWQADDQFLCHGMHYDCITCGRLMINPISSTYYTLRVRIPRPSGREEFKKQVAKWKEQSRATSEKERKQMMRDVAIAEHLMKVEDSNKKNNHFTRGQVTPGNMRNYPLSHSIDLPTSKSVWRSLGIDPLKSITTYNQLENTFARSLHIHRWRTTDNIYKAEPKCSMVVAWYIGKCTTCW